MGCMVAKMFGSLKSIEWKSQMDRVPNITSIGLRFTLIN